MNSFVLLLIFLLVLRSLVECLLIQLNQEQALRFRHAPPPALQGLLDAESYAKSVNYSLAKGRFSLAETTYGALVLGIFLFSGVLPAWYGKLEAMVGNGVWMQALFVLSSFVFMDLFSLPFSWWRTFRLEERFGFNRSTLKIWLGDLLKGFLLLCAIGLPLLWLLFRTAEWLGPAWWLAGFGLLSAFQILMMVLYPRFIMPLFNKFSPLEEGPLKTRLFSLAQRVRFPVQDIKVMDGSKRSRHSNAFFAGFGRLRRIVLFDTLLQQSSPEEIEAVLAHEIGHSKKRHTLKLILLSLASTFLAFWLVSVVQQHPFFSAALGFREHSLGVILVLLMLAGGLFSFWFSPLQSALSRRYEYQADAFAAHEAGLEGGGKPLAQALKKLQKENLGNLTPHPAMVFFHYSHPPLKERLERLEGA